MQVKTPGNKDAVGYLRANPHRLQLGNLGFIILKKSGQPAGIKDLRNIYQELNPWTGEIQSHFTVEGTAVDVVTVGHQAQDAMDVRVESELLKTGRLKVAVRFPFPTADWADMGTDYSHPENHQSAVVEQEPGRALLTHQLDTTKYFVAVEFASTTKLAPTRPHELVLTPSREDRVLELSCKFSPRKSTPPFTFEAIQAGSRQQWQAFWRSGAAVDFSGTADPRAAELERRVVLSQYLTRIHNAGSQPPQETGLLLNSWHARPHLEMHWWPAAHFALWGRPEMRYSGPGAVQGRGHV